MHLSADIYLDVCQDWYTVYTYKLQTPLFQGWTVKPPGRIEVDTILCQRA